MLCVAYGFGCVFIRMAGWLVCCVKICHRAHTVEGYPAKDLFVIQCVAKGDIADDRNL